MTKQNKFNSIFAIITMLALILACGGANQQAEANKIVAEANQKLNEAKELITKTEARNSLLFGANIQTVPQLRAYKAKMETEARDIVGSYEKVGEMLKDISKRYDEISRMKLDEKYKEYAKTKSEEFARRAEAIDIRKGNAAAFIEIDDPKAMTAKFDDNNDKSAKLFKEADELGNRAKQMEEENKDLFRQA